MAYPELPFGPPGRYSAGPAGTTATGLSSGVDYIRVSTDFDLEADQRDDAVAELRRQAEALGYEFVDPEHNDNIIKARSVEGLAGSIVIRTFTTRVSFSLNGSVS